MSYPNTPPLTLAIGQDVQIQAGPVVLIDISSWTLVGYFATSYGTPIYTLNVGNGGISYDSTSGTDGIFYINLTRLETGVLNTGQYTLAVWRTDVNSSDPLLTTNINMVIQGRPYP